MAWPSFEMRVVSVARSTTCASESPCASGLNASFKLNGRAEYRYAASTGWSKNRRYSDGTSPGSSASRPAETSAGFTWNWYALMMIVWPDSDCASSGRAPVNASVSPCGLNGRSYVASNVNAPETGVCSCTGQQLVVFSQLRMSLPVNSTLKYSSYNSTRKTDAGAPLTT